MRPSPRRTSSGRGSGGTKIPIVTGAYTSEAGKPEGTQTQFQYVDVGIKITASDIHEDGNHLAFKLNAEISSVAAPSVLNGVSEPVLRQNIWSGDVLIPVGKPTTAFKSDSLDNKGSMQLEVTASPVE